MTNLSPSVPSISVVMAVYNGDRYLSETIDSVLNQTFPEFEFVIVDDGSTDKTWEILTAYGDRDTRIKLFRNETNIGQINAVNKALNLAQGNYIARHDADDISLPERFEKQILILDNHPDIILVSSDMDVIDEAGNYLWKLQRACDSRLIPWYLLFYNRIAGHSQVMFRREPVIALGGYEGVDSNLDYILWNRLIKLGEFEILPDILLKYRRHTSSVTFTQNSAQMTSSLNQSRANIKQLTGENPTLEEVMALRSFWLFSDATEYLEVIQKQNPSHIHTWLARIFHAFLKTPRQQNPKYAVNPHELRQLIRHRFVSWANYLSWRKNFKSKFQVLFYAFLWNL